MFIKSESRKNSIVPIVVFASLVLVGCSGNTTEGTEQNIEGSAAGDAQEMLTCKMTLVSKAKLSVADKATLLNSARDLFTIEGKLGDQVSKYMQRVDSEHGPGKAKALVYLASFGGVIKTPLHMVNNAADLETGKPKADYVYRHFYFDTNPDQLEGANAWWYGQARLRAVQDLSNCVTKQIADYRGALVEREFCSPLRGVFEESADVQDARISRSGFELIEGDGGYIKFQKSGGFVLGFAAPTSVAGNIRCLHEKTATKAAREYYNSPVPGDIDAP
jgi:predicted small secreted protein